MSNYIYIIHPYKYIVQGKQYFKVGHTSQDPVFKRFRASDYRLCHIYFLTIVNDALTTEQIILSRFKKLFTLVEGRETFEGDIYSMIQIAAKLCRPIQMLHPSSQADIVQEVFKRSSLDTKRNLLSLSKSHYNLLAKHCIIPDTQQLTFLDCYKKGLNIILHGPAGCGKTHCIKILQKYTDILTIGYTSYNANLISGIPFRTLMDCFISGIKEPALTANYTLSSINTIVIDEVGMMSEKDLLRFDLVLRTITKVSKPFGGKQIVLVGDFLQLGSATEDHLVTSNRLGSLGFHFISLREVYRYSDTNTRDIIRSVRDGKHLYLKHNRTSYDDQYSPVILVETDQEAHEGNKGKLRELPGKTKAFSSTGLLDHAFGADTNEPFIYPQALELRKQAQVMLLRDLSGYGLYHGSIGVVEYWTEYYIGVKFLGHDYVTQIHRHTIPNYLSSIAGSSSYNTMNYTQFPLCLAWYLSIYQVQGKTLDRILISESKLPGFLYTAVSRIKNIQNVGVFSDQNHQEVPNIVDIKVYKELSLLNLSRDTIYKLPDIPSEYGNSYLDTRSNDELLQFLGYSTKVTTKSIASSVAVTKDILCNQIYDRIKGKTRSKALLEKQIAPILYKYSIPRQLVDKQIASRATSKRFIRYDNYWWCEKLIQYIWANVDKSTRYILRQSVL